MAIRSKSYQETIAELRKIEENMNSTIDIREKARFELTEKLAKAEAEVVALNVKVKILGDELSVVKDALKRSETMYREAVKEHAAFLAKITEATKPKPDAPPAQAEDKAPEAATPPATTEAA
jgi:chromosome segregation ATPase